MQVYKAFSLTHNGFTLLLNSRTAKNKIKSSRSVQLTSLNLKHGDTIYLYPVDAESPFPIPGPSNANSANGSRSSSVVSTPGSNTSSNEKKNSGSNSQIEDEVDKQLWKLDGKIKRLKDKK